MWTSAYAECFFWSSTLYDVHLMVPAVLQRTSTSSRSFLLHSGSCSCMWWNVPPPLTGDYGEQPGPDVCCASISDFYVFGHPSWNSCHEQHSKYWNVYKCKVNVKSWQNSLVGVTVIATERENNGNIWGIEQRRQWWSAKVYWQKTL